MTEDPVEYLHHRLTGYYSGCRCVTCRTYAAELKSRPDTSTPEHDHYRTCSKSRCWRCWALEHAFYRRQGDTPTPKSKMLKPDGNPDPDMALFLKMTYGDDLVKEIGVASAG